MLRHVCETAAVTQSGDPREGRREAFWRGVGLFFSGGKDPDRELSPWRVWFALVNVQIDRTLRLPKSVRRDIPFVE